MRRLLLVSLACLLVSVGAVTNLDGVYGTFESPNFPDPYANDLSEEWGIQVRKGYKIRLKFTAFDLEDSYDADLGGACIYDYVKISEAGQQLLRFCGKARYHADTPTINHWYHSKENNITVEFVTDYSNEGISPSGFAAHYAEEDIDECARMEHLKHTTLDGWDELVTCNHFCINVPGSYFCDCRAGFELAPNKHTCVAKFCENQKLTDLEGMVESPDYPYKYGKLSKCRWDINVPKGYSIHLTFDAPFDIEEHYEEGCVYDYLTINYKDHSDKSCGSVAPHANRTWDLNTRDVLIQFQSDLSVEGAGFRFHYNTSKIRCLTELQAPTNGSITSVNPKGYFEFEDSITFACDLGFDMEGHHTTHCNNEGEWTHPVPKCQIISCGPPKNLTSVRYSTILDFASKTYEYLETVTLKCNEWYEQTAGYAEWKCEHTKKWIPNPGAQSVGSGDIPICRPVCGRRLVQDDAFTTHVSGGKQVTKLGGWPWMAFVDLGGEGGGGRFGEFYCGGTLVDEMTVVTAAHCVNQIDPNADVTVWLGLLNRTEAPYNFTQSFTVTSANRFVHDQFSENTLNGAEILKYYDYDVGVLKLDRPADLSYFVRPVCLPYGGLSERLLREFRNSRAHKAIATGWGFTEEKTLAKVLRKVRLSIVSTERCRDNFQHQMDGGNGAAMITDNMICAGLNLHRTETSIVVSDTCKADSGGPLMTRTGRNKAAVWYLSGVTSFGDERLTDGTSRCGAGETYGVYTDVGKVMDFIELHLSQKN